VTVKEREEALELFGGEQGQRLAAKLASERTEPNVAGAGQKGAPTPAQLSAIRVCALLWWLI